MKRTHPWRPSLLAWSWVALALTCSWPHAGYGQAAIRFSHVLRVGEMEGDQSRVFGLIKDVASDDRGNFAVLDAQAQRVQVFSPTGAFLQQIGKPGRGPGEFAVPVALTYGEDGTLFVADVSNRRVEVFERNDSVLRRSSSFPMDFHVSDFCTIGDELYLLGYREGRMVHVYDREGRHRRSFGVPERMNDDYLRTTFSEGVIACLEEPGALLVLPLLSDRLRVFSLEGEEMWHSRIPDYEHVTIERRGGSITFSRPSGRHHMTSSISVLGPNRAIVQVGFIGEGAKNSEEMTAVTSYLVQARPGAIIRMSDGTPRIVHMGSERAYSPRPEPYPHVSIFRVSEPGGRRP